MSSLTSLSKFQIFNLDSEFKTKFKSSLCRKTEIMDVGVKLVKKKDIEALIEKNPD